MLVTIFDNIVINPRNVTSLHKIDIVEYPEGYWTGGVCINQLDYYCSSGSEAGAWNKAEKAFREIKDGMDSA